MVHYFLMFETERNFKILKIEFSNFPGQKGLSVLLRRILNFMLEILFSRF